MNVLNFKGLMLNWVAASALVSPNLRHRIYKWCGVKICNSVAVYHRCFLGGTDIRIADNVFINCGCFLDNSAAIEIGENTFLAMEVMLCTSTHDSGTASKRAGKVIGKPVKIGKGCWLGARVMVCLG